MVDCVCIAAVVGVLVGTGFEENQGPSGPSRRTSVTCCSILDDMLYCESCFPPSYASHDRFFNNLFIFSKKVFTHVDAYLNSPNQATLSCLSIMHSIMDISFSHFGLLDSLDRLQAKPCGEAAVENW